MSPPGGGRKAAKSVLFCSLVNTRFPLMRKTETPLPGGVLARLPRLKAGLAADPRVVFAYLFGGLARGRVTPLSDADIAVFLNAESDFAEARLDLIGSVTEALGSDAVDVVILNEAPIALAGRIQQCAEVLVDRDPPRRYAYESLTRRMFWDFRKIEDRILEARYGVSR